MRLLRRALMVFMALTLGAVGTLVWWISSGATVLTVTSTVQGGQQWRPGTPTFVLLIGDDKRPGAGCGCTDAIHVVGVPAGGGQAVMLDIPRDTRVNIPGAGTRKINEAYSRGGAELSAQVVGALVGVQISFVVHVNFVEFPALVDEIGGVDVDVPFAIRDSGSGGIFAKGVNHMNGDAALKFARSRHIPGGDFARSEDQGRLILAALAKLRSQGTGGTDALRYLGLLMRHTDTRNMGGRELYRLARLALTIDPAAVRNVVMPGASAMIRGTSYVVTTAAAAPLFADFADDAVLQTH